MKFNILSKKQLFQYKFLQIEEAEVDIERYDGEQMRLQRIGMIRPRVVAVLLKNITREKFLFVEQFRYSMVGFDTPWVTEIVAGVVDPGENPDVAVVRECLEETGYLLKKPKYVRSFMSSIGLSDQMIDFYYGEVEDSDKIEQGGGLKDETEDIRVVEYEISDAYEKSEKGEFVDGKTMFALDWHALNHR